MVGIIIVALIPINRRQIFSTIIIIFLTRPQYCNPISCVTQKLSSSCDFASVLVYLHGNKFSFTLFLSFLTCLVLLSYSCWSFVDVPLIFSFLIQQNTYYRLVVPDWQQKLIISLGMVEALSDGYGKRKRGQPAKRLEHRVTEYCTAFGIDPKCWMRAAQDAPEWYRKVETGAEVFMSAWSTKRVNETNARHAKELFATLPFELP